MFTEILRYQLADGQDPAEFLKVCERIHTEWMQHVPGFIEWEINHLTDNSYVDMVAWESAEAANTAQAAMAKIEPELSKAWQGCYDMKSVSADRVSRVKQFG